MRVLNPLLSLVVALSLVSLGRQALASCNGACGGAGSAGCYCDDMCFDYGDCCSDVCNYCPTLAGCGGGTSDCGDGYCGPNEDGSTCPQDCSSGCGSVSYEGCCSGETVKYCEAGVLKSIDCNKNPSCGWQSEGNYYDCGTVGGADPSGTNPKSCTGGSQPICGNGYCEAGENATNCAKDCGGSQPVCGNGKCEVGETAQSCPSDCAGTQPVCGNGTCEAGESQGSCPADCGGGCGGKQCGFDGQGNPCGTCPEGQYCTWDGLCKSAEPCVPDCTGKQCGDDGCEGSCGSCPAGLVCSEAGVCSSPYAADVEGGGGGDEDANCTPDCDGRVCGSDGCGGSCGECPEGYGCTAGGLCMEGYVPPEDEEEDPDDSYACPPGQTLLYGKCVVVGVEDDKAGDCSHSSRPETGALWLLALLALGLAGGRRRQRAVRG